MTVVTHSDFSSDIFWQFGAHIDNKRVTFDINKANPVTTNIAIGSQTLWK